MSANLMPEPGNRATGREWAGLAVLALPTLLLALDVSVLFLALPHLSADLQPSSTQLLWITDIYGFMVAGFLVTMGTLGDRIGRRRLLLAGASAFATASVLAAYSASAEMLIAARALLGIAGATLAPSTLALISNMFRDPKQRAVAIAVWMSCFVGGTAIGPVVGGLLLESFWWGSAFLLGVPVMAVLLVTAPLLLPEYRGPQPGRLDLASVALSLAAILPVIYGLKELANNGLQPLPVVAVVAGVAVGVVFVRRQRTLASPLLDVHLFGSRAFSAALAVFLLSGAIMGGIYLFVTQYLQRVEGLSPLRAGLWLVPSTLAMITASLLAPHVARRVRSGWVMAAGLALAGLGLALLTQVGGSGGLAILVAGFTLAGFGMGSPAALTTDLVVGSAPPERAGSAASMSETSGEFGIALGIAALGSIGTAVYRGQISDAIPAGVPSAVTEAAREGLAGAAAAAGQLPAELAHELLAGASEAFVTALTTVSGIGAAAFAGLAVLAAGALRNVAPIGAAQPEVPPAAAPPANHDPEEAPMQV
jgi:MFS transporter, DHA2 family, multidrug resistance protein